MAVSEPSIVPFEAEPTEIPGLVVFRMRQVTDERGTVREFYRGSAFASAGLPSVGPWVQLNLTETRPGAVRGLHAEAMDKLVAVAAGTAFGVYVDVRAGSPTFGRVVTVGLTPGVQVFVPSGVCNGFQATGPGTTQYLYGFTTEWTPDMPGTSITPLDPDLAIRWPIPVDPDDPAQISAKDAAAPRLAEVRAQG